MEDSNLTFSLPYKVKISEEVIEKNINFSIMMITHNNEDKIINISNHLKEYKEMGGDVFILDVASTDKTIQISEELGYIVEDGSSFLREVDDEMSNLINDRFSHDEEKIIKNGDVYIDHSSAMNYLSSLSNTDLVLFISPNHHIINTLNTNELINFINENNNNNLYYTVNKDVILYNKTKNEWINLNNCVLRGITNIEYDSTKNYNIPSHIIGIYDDEIPYIERNKEILIGLAVNCYLEPDNNNISQIFAIELKRKKYNASSFNEFNRHISISPSEVERCISLVYIGDFFINSERIEEGLNSYHKAYIECSLTRVPLYKLGEYFYYNEKKDKSIFYLEGCLNITTKPSVRYDDHPMYNDGPYSMLYVAYWWTGNPEKGKYYFDKAISINPHHQLYIDESIYHYKYKGNNLSGNLNFQEIQYLYDESSKYDSILEIYPSEARGTHALINGCDGLVTVLLQDENIKEDFLQKLYNPGNLKIITKPSNEIFNDFKEKSKKFDMVIVHDNINNIDFGDDTNWEIFNWEDITNKIICGVNYTTHKEIIDSKFEISGTKEKLWYKNFHKFEKTIIYKRK